MAEMAEGCRAFEADLSAWIDGELAPERRAEVEAHLGACSRCTGRARELRGVDRALASLAAPAVAADLRARLERRLTSRQSADRVRPPLRRRRFFVALPAAAAAALALYLLVRPADLPVGPAERVPVAKAPSPEPPESTQPEARPQIAARPQPEIEKGELEALDADLVAVALELDTIEDLPVIANLELLERMLEPDAG